MNRIGGPSAWPHSRTCSRTPPPPATVWTCIRPAIVVVIFRPPRSSRADSRSSSPAVPERVGRSVLSCAPGRPIYCPRNAYERLPPWWQPRDTGRVEPRAKAFVGRAGGLGTLERALAAARAGHGAAILVAGEAGIGKTRLAAELARRAREAGCQTLLGRSIDLVGTELPYQPFAEALRPLGGGPTACAARVLASCWTSARSRPRT